MLLVDANVLVHAVNLRSREHTAAHTWLTGVLAGRESVGFAWTVLLAFWRLTTHPAVFPRPLAPEQAADVLAGWVEAPAALVVEPTRRHLPLMRGLLAGAGTAGNLVGDAHLAALALEHDATVISFDRDFGRFAGLTWRVPS